MTDDLGGVIVRTENPDGTTRIQLDGCAVSKAMYATMIPFEKPSRRKRLRYYFEDIKFALRELRDAIKGKLEVE